MSNPYRERLEQIAERAERLSGSAPETVYFDLVTGRLSITAAALEILLAKVEPVVEPEPVLRCIDCDCAVTFDPHGFLPWIDGNGSGYCGAASEHSRKTGQGFHRLPTVLAEQVFDDHLVATGARSRHDVRRG